jgi:acyl-CoA hydrolase
VAGKVTEGVFTFVAIDEEGRPRPLPAEEDRRG